MTKYADCLSLILHSCDFDDSLPGSLYFIHQLCISQFVFCKRVDIRDRFTPCALITRVSCIISAVRGIGRIGANLADELYFVAFDVFDSKDFEFGEEMEREIVYSVAKNGFLNKEDVAACFLNLFAHVEQIGPLLL